MKISVLVKPNSRREEVVEGTNGVLTVRVSGPPIEGRANTRLVEVLAVHFRKPKSSIRIVSGLSGKRKIVEIQ